ncbi:MAG: Lpg1974 family pore-forming outer membrane protein [Parachlamydiales bacterium]
MQVRLLAALLLLTVCCYGEGTPWRCSLSRAAFSLEAGSNVLYWRAGGDGIQYCVIDNSPDLSFSRYVLPRSRFGYDVWGRAHLFSPCFAIAGRYVSFNSHGSEAVQAPSLVRAFDPTPATATAASAQLRQKYRSADAEAHWSLASSCVLSGALFGGVRYFDLAQHENYAYVSGMTTTLGDQSTRYQGWGPRLGLHFSFSPCKLRCVTLALNGHFAATAAIGTRKLATSASFAPPGPIAYPNRRVLEPACDWRLELKGSLCGRGVTVTGRIGYELNSYFGGLSRIDATNDLAVLTPVEKTGSFGGPYGGISIGY